MDGTDPRPHVHATASVRNSRLGRFTEVGARTSVAETEMGDYSYVVNDADIIYTTIGKFCSIAAHTRINPGNHPMQRVSQSHFTYRASRYFKGESDEASFFDWRRSHRVRIGHDVWIGHGAIVLPGRCIGHGAVVAAGAIVTRDVASYAIFAGNPARFVRWRFDPSIVDRLLRLSWWDWEHSRLHEALGDFRNLSVSDFVEKHSN